ncbi:unnamed protein product [Hydatigera taeniaeformis]|uniref:TATA box-binding protein-associated factor RNA polymerase I subunit B n=1 Tax=Hydatigena taeniaeformis TaxID=6205 RepID=A0A0R3WHS5_HYDTA|nr:unnamed protein product [Hydatigera taeniaeformis]
MLPGSLKCCGCGGGTFCVDEVSGQYVCASCWQVSDFFEGVDQSHECSGSRYGLRVVSTGDSFSQRSAPYGSALSEGEIQNASCAFDLPISASSTKQSGRKAHGGSSADHAATVLSSIIVNERHFNRKGLRSWRMSEAFTVRRNLVSICDCWHSECHYYSSLNPRLVQQKFFHHGLLLRNQLRALICAHLTPEPASFPGFVDRFTSIANTLWTNYLGATGELGGDLWALSFRRMLAALELTLESRRAYIHHCNPERRSGASQVLPRVGRTGGKGSLHLTHILESNLGFGFCWIGWGSLYCPDESENANNPLFLFEMNMDQETSFSVKCSSEDDEDLDSVYEAPPQKRPRRLILLPQAQQVPEDQDGLLNDLANLSKMWKKILTENLIKKHPRSEIFWHGHLGKNRSNWLLEYNLGILFLAAFLTLTVINSRKIPICRHDFLTLHDLSCLCQDRDKFPYLLADRWVSNHFASFNPNIQKSLKRPLMPDPLVLAGVTVHLINMLGITERPRLPLCSLVHRLLRKMTFPPEAHQIANSLVKRLARCVENNAAERKAGMHYFLPLQRYLRGEVFAMAIVTITGRLLFKLDGDFEHRWSKVARFLAKHPQETALLEEVLSEGAQTGPKCRTVPFDWSSWVCRLPNGPPSLRRLRSRFSNGDAPLNAALTHSHLVRTARNTKEFLGTASSFDPQVDEGWGEKHGSARCHGSASCSNFFAFKKVTKLNLTKSLMQLIGHSFTTNDSIEMPRRDTELQSLPCKSCAHSKKHAIFWRASDQVEDAKWADQNCDALVRAYRFIQQKKIPASELLNKVHPPTSKFDDIRMEWLRVLESFDSYDPISGIDFTVDLDKTSSPTAPPPTVMKFARDYKEQVLDFLSGKNVISSAATNDSTAHTEASSLANASLHWFLKTASSMCGAKLPQLLREIECIEHLLGWWPGEALKSQTKLRNLALAFHFDYTVCE